MANPFVIAIDFGTSFSGYAFSMSPLGAAVDAHSRKWGEEYRKDTPKTPTCILFDEQEEFLKFGYDAQMAYVSMSCAEAKSNFFFYNFKMALYGTNFSSNTKITAANGLTMPALKVFTEALRYMKDEALKAISRNVEGTEVTATDFTWVLTVPAIWDPVAKQFMRKVAMEAGLISRGQQEKLVLALEPEAASVWCKSLPPEGFMTQNHGGEKLDQRSGTQYIVVDCGGGTIDITVHEVLEGGALKELHRASGNELGGQTVDSKFKEFLREIFCGGVWDEYEKEYPSEVQDIMYDFMLFKKKCEDVRITCSINLGEVAKKKTSNMADFFSTINGATWDGCIKISKEKMRSFFEVSLNGTTKLIREILKTGLNIDYILLVGGFAESQILWQHMKREFRSCKVLCPFRAQEAVMIGAVMFGRQPHVVVSRKSAYTYGIAISERFNKSKHKEEKKLVNSDGEWCMDLLKVLVESTEDVGWDETRNYTFGPIESTQQRMNFRFFQTERRSPAPAYVDEWGLQQIGSFSVDMPDTTRGMNRTVRLEVSFGFTEMRATATDLETNSRQSITLDFARH